MGRTDQAAVIGQQAVDVLERQPPGHELAMAYCNISHLRMNEEDMEGTVAWGRRAMALAEQLDDLEALVYALINIGNMEYLAGKAEGVEKLERALQLAQEAGLEEHAGRAFVDFVWWAPHGRRYEFVDRYLESGLQYCNDHGLDLWRLCRVACRARSELDHGQWDHAAESAALVIHDPRSSPVPRVVALAVLGLVRARRGDPDHRTLLEQAWALAEPTAELQRIGPAAAARAEAGWLNGDTEMVNEATRGPLDLAMRREAGWLVAELGYWRQRAGMGTPVLAGAGGPWALQVAGRWAESARAWSELGCPYEAAQAGAEGDEPAALRHALSEFERLGARPSAAAAARRLRELGVRSLPRGPRASTRANPGGLTAREIEVLGLLGEGLRNRQIAVRLHLSSKTIDHHVSAILGKLEVRTRTEAARAAAEFDYRPAESATERRGVGG